MNIKKVNNLLVNSKSKTYYSAVILYFYLKSYLKQKRNVTELRVNRKELASIMNCTKSTITKNLAILEKKGLLKRIIKDTSSKEGNIERNTLFIELLNITKKGSEVSNA